MDKHMSVYEQDEHYDYLLALKNEVLKINEEVRKDGIKAEKLKLKTLLNTDFDNFYAKVMEAQYSQKPVPFQDIQPITFFNAFKKINNKQKLDFIYMISGRFLDKNKTLEIADDLELLKGIKAKVDNVVKQKPINNSGALYRKLQHALEQSINSINELKALYSPSI